MRCVDSGDDCRYVDMQIVDACVPHEEEAIIG